VPFIKTKINEISIDTINDIDINKNLVLNLDDI